MGAGISEKAQTEQTESTQDGLRKKDFYFELPQELIAQDPLEERSSSRLLVLDKHTGAMSHCVFRDVISYLRPGDCLVLNNTKVIPARLLGEREGTGGRVEVLLLKRSAGDIWETLVKHHHDGETGEEMPSRNEACLRKRSAEGTGTGDCGGGQPADKI